MGSNHKQFNKTYSNFMSISHTLAEWLKRLQTKLHITTALSEPAKLIICCDCSCERFHTYKQITII